MEQFVKVNVTSKNILEWYNTTIPKLIFTMSEDDIIQAMRDALGVKSDFDFLWENSEYYDPQLSYADYLENVDTNHYSAITLKLLFSQAAYLEDITTMLSSVQEKVVPQEDVLNWTWFLLSLKNDRLVHLPIWMRPIEKFGLFKHLNIINAVDDRDWPIFTASETWTNVMATITDFSLYNVSEWGNYIPSNILSEVEMSLDGMRSRHNALIWHLTKRLANRRYWDVETGTLIEHLTNVTSRDKVTALSILEILVYYRLLNYREELVTHKRPRYMLDLPPSTKWLTKYCSPSALDQYANAYEPLIDVWHAISKMKAWNPPPMLGNGSLVSTVLFIPANPISANRDGYPENVNSKTEFMHCYQILSSGLFPAWMCDVISQLRLRAHPVLTNPYAGSWDCTSPEISGDVMTRQGTSRQTYGRTTTLEGAARLIEDVEMMSAISGAQFLKSDTESATPPVVGRSCFGYTSSLTWAFLIPARDTPGQLPDACIFPSLYAHLQPHASTSGNAAVINSTDITHYEPIMI